MSEEIQSGGCDETVNGEPPTHAALLVHEYDDGSVGQYCSAKGSAMECWELHMIDDVLVSESHRRGRRVVRAHHAVIALEEQE